MKMIGHMFDESNRETIYSFINRAEGRKTKNFIKTLVQKLLPRLGSL